MKKEISYMSDEMDKIAEIPIPRWRINLAYFLLKIINVKFGYPYRWRYRGRKLGRRPTGPTSTLRIRTENGKLVIKDDL